MNLRVQDASECQAPKLDVAGSSPVARSEGITKRSAYSAGRFAFQGLGTRFIRENGNPSQPVLGISRFATSVDSAAAADGALYALKQKAHS